VTKSKGGGRCVCKSSAGNDLRSGLGRHRGELGMASQGLRQAPSVGWVQISI
jgi:hypothetical protein